MTSYILVPAEHSKVIPFARKRKQNKTLGVDKRCFRHSKPFSYMEFYGWVFFLCVCGGGGCGLVQILITKIFFDRHWIVAVTSYF